ncbi:MAG: leucine-rich repeat protein [Planctomycetia bacterium]|nr:leucine-rich repeat protein [Planctomycetia bacterium]
MKSTKKHPIFLFIALLFLFLTPYVSGEEKEKTNVTVFQKVGIELEFQMPDLPDFSVEALPGLEGEQEEFRKQCETIAKRCERKPEISGDAHYNICWKAHTDLWNALKHFNGECPWRERKLEECARMQESIKTQCGPLFQQLIASFEKVPQNEQITPEEYSNYFMMCFTMFHQMRESMTEEEGYKNLMALKWVAEEADARDTEARKAAGKLPNYRCSAMWESARHALAGYMRLVGVEKGKMAKEDSPKDYESRYIHVFEAPRTKTVGVCITKYKNQNATSVTIPKRIDFLPVQCIASGAFSGCKNLTSVTLPESVTTIERDAFSGCTALTSVSIPAGAQVDVYAFRGCTSMPGYSETEIRVHEGNTVVKEKQFLNDAVVTTITIPESVTSIESKAFSGCTALTTLQLPKNVENFGKNAFQNCSSLKSVALPNGVKEITSGMFSGCVALESITVPASTERIEIHDSCKNLKAFHAEPENATYKSVDGVLFSKDGKKLVKFPHGSEIREYTVPDGVTEIEPGAFRDCRKLVSVTIPETVIAMNVNAFSGVSNDFTLRGRRESYADFFALDFKLKFIAITADGQIDDTPLEEAQKTLRYTLLDGVVHVTGLRHEVTPVVEIPAKIKGYPVTAVDWAAFHYKRHVRKVRVSEENEYFQNRNGIIFSKDGKTLIRCLTSNMRNEEIPAGVTTIAPRAFAECGGLTTLTIPESVTTIGDKAFANCPNLLFVKIPASVTKIGEEVFRQVPITGTYSEPIVYVTRGSYAETYVKLNKIRYILPNVETQQVSEKKFVATKIIDSQSIEYSLEYDSEEQEDHSEKQDSYHVVRCGDRGVISIVIPAKIHGIPVTCINHNAFEECQHLESITIPEGITEIGNSAFSGCISLTSVTIPESVSIIGHRAFWRCIALETVQLPKKLTNNFGPGVFCHCASLKSIDLPNGMKEFRFGMFKNCVALETITLPESIETVEGFGHFPNLKAIYVSPDNPNFKSVDGVLYSKNGKTLLRFPRNSEIREYVVPDGVTGISDAAFSGCAKLISVKIPEGVTYVGVCSFWNCPNLRSVTVPASAEIHYDEENYNGAFETSDAYPDDFAIYGKPGSWAEKYAEEHKIQFVAE